MTDYREILRLSSQGISQRGIAASCSCSRNTVAKVLKRAQEQSVGWPLKDDVTSGDLHRLPFGELTFPPLRQRPDYERIHRDMAKSGVTLSLLWNGKRQILHTSRLVLSHEILCSSELVREDLL